MKVSKAKALLMKATPIYLQKEMQERYDKIPNRCPECGDERDAFDSSAGYTVMCLNTSKLCTRWHSVVGVLVTYHTIEAQRQKIRGLYIEQN